MQKPEYTYFFDKQLALKWQIGKHVSGLNPLSLSFSFIINTKQVLGEQYTKILLSRKHYWENCDLWIGNYQFTTLQI